MTVEFLNAEDGTVQLRTINAPANAPEWLLIKPDGEKAKMLALPTNHFFDGRSGQWGASAEIVDAARRYLAGELDKAAAEQSIAASLTWWCEASRGTP